MSQAPIPYKLVNNITYNPKKDKNKWEESRDNRICWRCDTISVMMQGDYIKCVHCGEVYFKI